MLSLRNLTMYFTLLALPIWLNGCAINQAPVSTQIAVPKYLTWQQRQTELNNLQTWTAEGSLSVTFDHKTDIAYFAWQQNAKNYGIDLHAPLNLKQLQLVGNDKQVTLWESETSISAPTPEALLKERLGWTLPIANLVYWIRGVPAPTSATTPIATQQLDNFNHLTHMQQQGWDIQYVDFQAINNIDLPHIIYLQTEGLKIKIVIKKWVWE
jgi:outer membrane lipoprotein LolB